MIVFTPENRPKIVNRVEQTTAVFEHNPGDGRDAERAFVQEVIARADIFPTLASYSFIVTDYRNEQPNRGRGIIATYINAATMEWLVDWEVSSSTDFPLLDNEDLAYQMRLGYEIVFVASDDYVFMMESMNEEAFQTNYYGKVPKKQFEAQNKQLATLTIAS